MYRTSGCILAFFEEFNLSGSTHRLMTVNRYYYVLGDGVLLPVQLESAWCEHCQKFVAAEKILTIDEELKELSEAEYYAANPGLTRPVRLIPNVAQLEQFRLRKIWRAKRSSRAKCLVCGSTSIISIHSDSTTDIPNRGKCMVTGCGFADVPDKPVDEYFNSEGDRIDFPSPLAHRRM